MQKKLKEETDDLGSHLEKIESTTVGGAWQRELEAAGRIASVARKQREEDRERDWCSAHFFSVLLTSGPRPRNDATHIQGVGLPFSGQPPPETPPEVCLLGDCKTSQVDGIN